MMGFLKPAAALAVSVAAGAATGGWAVVSVTELPEYFVAGQQYAIQFQIRQHGRNLLPGLEPRLVVSTSERRLGGLIGGKDEVSVPATSVSPGVYSATFTAPVADRVFITIRSGFGPSDLRLYPQPVIARGTTRAAMAPAERGQVLFVAKGCNTCHANTDLAARPDNNTIAAGPELGGRRLAAQYVIQKLKNPSQNMPDLGLTDSEAGAIAAFLSGERVAATGGK
jgi:hypothetical protein